MASVAGDIGATKESVVQSAPAPAPAPATTKKPEDKSATVEDAVPDPDEDDLDDLDGERFFLRCVQFL
jgi:hypothetical protein